MRTVVAIENVSLDGFADSGIGLGFEWTARAYDEEVDRYSNEHVHADVDTAMYGRATYLGMQGFWSQMLDNPSASEGERAHAQWVHDVEKVVFSTTLDSADWNNSTLVTDLPSGVKDLAGRDGGTMAIYASPKLVHSFFEHGWLDELRVMVHPVILGGGTPLIPPATTEVHGLAALVGLQASRLTARTSTAAAVVLLADQDRSRWDQLLIRRGYSALHRAHQLNREQHRDSGRFALQGAIAAEHAIARTPEATNWARLVKLYDQLWARYPSPMVQLNRAVAVGMADGPAAGLVALDEITASRRLDSYHLLAAVRADLLRRLGRLDDAAVEYERAAGLATNDAEQNLLRTRAAQCADGTRPVGLS